MKIVPFASPIHDPKAVEDLLEKIRNLIKRYSSDELKLDQLRTSPLNKEWEYTIPFIVTGGSEWIVSGTYQIVAPPIILYHDGMNSLPAALEIASYFRANGANTLLIRIEDFFEKYEDYIKIANTAWDLRLRRTRLGLIGGISKWLIYSCPPRDELLRKGYNLIEIPLEELVETYNNILKNEQNKDKEKLDDLDKANIAYKALKEIAMESRLNALTVNCFKFLAETGTTLCYAFSLLNSEAIVAGCEGDLPSTIAMHIGFNVFGTPGFMANINKVDLKEGKIIMSHCTAPAKILKKYSYTTHYETGKSIAISGVFEENTQCILLRLSGKLDKARIIEGYIIGNPSDKELCRTRALIKVGKSAAESIIKNPMGNHYVLFITSHEKTKYLEELLEVLGFKNEVFYLK